MQKKYLWLAVTPDEYELPLIVADSAAELGRKCGISKSTIKVAERLGCSGERSGRKIVKVRI
jgi:ribosomal protein L7Ae-like RNA K-turn-binding protein